MSGPIIRKYGFPNFEEIFGKRELQHGIDEKDSATKKETSAATTVSKTEPTEPAAKEKTN